MDVRVVLACFCLLLAVAEAGEEVASIQQDKKSLDAAVSDGDEKKEQLKSRKTLPVISPTQTLIDGNSVEVNITSNTEDSSIETGIDEAKTTKLLKNVITPPIINTESGKKKPDINIQKSNPDKIVLINPTSEITKGQSKLLEEKRENEGKVLTHSDQVTNQTATGGSFNPDDSAAEGSVPSAPEGEGSLERVLLVALGGGEDELFAANAAELLLKSGHLVAVIVYGTVREAAFPAGARLLVIPFAPADPLVEAGVSGADGAGSREWAAGRVVWSRLGACEGLPGLEEQVAELQPALLVTPLWLHDVCTLTLARRLSIPTIGVITSRVGAWWAWTQLGALPDLASASAPTGAVGDSGIFARASNLAQHYAFVATMRQRWQAPATATLPNVWGDQLPLPVLYRGLQRVLVAWDPILHPSPPHTPSAVSVGGFAADLTPITKDVLVPALLNKAGVVVVAVGGREVWVGAAAVAALYRTLAPLPYTVLWGGPHLHQRPEVPVGAGEGAEAAAFQVNAKFIFKEHIPLNGVLGHPRHRLLISCCGESDVMAAAHFASPVLCLPVTTDQALAAQHLARLGLAEVVPAWEVSEATLTKAFRNLFKDRRFRAAARALAEELHDTPLSPADRLLYHVQHAIRRPNSTRYQIHGSQLFLLQQGNADVYLLVLLLFTLLAGTVLAAIVAYGPILLKKTKKKED